MSLKTAVSDPAERGRIAAEAVAEADAAIRDMSGVRGRVVKAGFDTVQRLRPGFLEKHVCLLLPGWADAVDPWWRDGLAAGDAPAHLVSHADDVAEAMLVVTDAHAAKAGDGTARAVYDRLRPNAPTRIADHMPRLAAFIERNS